MNMNFDELMRLGRAHVADRVPDQSRQSLPVPARWQGQLRIGFLFAPAQMLPGVNRLAPPHYVAWLQPQTGALLELQAVSPQSLGQNHDPRELIGEFKLPEGMTGEDYLAERRRLFDLYPTLVAAWEQGGGRPAEHTLRAPAREFLRLFGVVSEPPLIRYYYALGEEFFSWVRAAARP